MFRNFYRLLKSNKLKTICRPGIPIFAASFIDKDKLKPFELTDPQALSHSFLIQQASVVTVNAASQLLTQTVVAIVETAEEYKVALKHFLKLLDDSKSPHSQYLEDLNDLLISARSQTNTLKKELNELFSLMDYVEKVAESSAETSYLLGSEYASTTMGERLHSARIKIEIAQKEIESLEQELLLIQKDLIIDDKNIKNKNH